MSIGFKNTSIATILSVIFSNSNVHAYFTQITERLQSLRVVPENRKTSLGRSFRTKQVGWSHIRLVLDSFPKHVFRFL